MLTSNEYFDGNVKSIGFATNEPGAESASVGVMAPGEYTFGTGKAEEMTVVSGKLRVLLPGTTAWQDFGPGAQFSVPGSSSFQLEVEVATAYLCRYLDA
ncbi:MAG TPA: pyrimidine/purine nucleoside phosphorylase [Plantibacter sp.]|uniref:pyrimidine/purine nucleoside phosphorylase n=1 Tax=unclassified Plantibacter TaxID=2624265 RepID=UPI002CBDA320|nr:pyrimidine/purine nucleoside phosphorylase [Plantibacter sp.]